jgi:hypothetical protein
MLVDVNITVDIGRGRCRRDFVVGCVVNSLQDAPKKAGGASHCVRNSRGR